MSPIDCYVADLISGLCGPPRRVADIGSEVRDGLEDLADQYRLSGIPRWEAERLAVEEFGPVELITLAFREVVAVRESRWTAMITSLVIAAQPLVWGYPYELATNGSGAAFGGAHAVLSIAVASVGMVSVLVMLLALGASYVGGLDLHRRWRLSSWVAWMGIMSAVIVGVLGVTLGAVGLVSSDVPVVLMVVWSSAFLFVPLAMSSRAARRTLEATELIWFG